MLKSFKDSLYPAINWKYVMMWEICILSKGVIALISNSICSRFIRGRKPIVTTLLLEQYKRILCCCRILIVKIPACIWKRIGLDIGQTSRLALSRWIKLSHKLYVKKGWARSSSFTFDVISPLDDDVALALGASFRSNPSMNECEARASTSKEREGRWIPPTIVRAFNPNSLTYFVRNPPRFPLVNDPDRSDALKSCDEFSSWGFVKLRSSSSALFCLQLEIHFKTCAHQNKWRSKQF
jgi:hypothetical protein